MLLISKYRFSELLCVITLLFGSMLFTGHTGKTTALHQTGTQTEWLLCNAHRLKKNTAAYHFTATVGQYKNLPCNAHFHTCFIFHQNRLSAIRLKTAALLTKQFFIHPKHLLQKAIPCSSPEHHTIS